MWNMFVDVPLYKTTNINNFTTRTTNFEHHFFIIVKASIADSPDSAFKVWRTVGSTVLRWWSSWWIFRYSSLPIWHWQRSLVGRSSRHVNCRGKRNRRSAVDLTIRYRQLSANRKENESREICVLSMKVNRRNCVLEANKNHDLSANHKTLTIQLSSMVPRAPKCYRQLSLQQSLNLFIASFFINPKIQFLRRRSLTPSMKFQFPLNAL